MERINDKPELYLPCFGTLFSIYHKSKNSLSQALTEEEHKNLISNFDKFEIPYETNINPLHDTLGAEIYDELPCNSRTVFKCDGQEYNVLNFNALLIKNVYAVKICRAFINKGFSSRVELVGPYSTSNYISSVKIEPTTQKPVKYIQSSLFEGKYLKKLIG